eukprot:7655834-Karenia_brevis.AAC.1
MIYRQGARSQDFQSSHMFKRRRRQMSPDILRNHKVIPDSGGNPDPRLMDVKDILLETPHTSFVTIIGRGTALLNRLCLEVQCGDRRHLKTIPGEYENNLNNYDVDGSLVDSQPCIVPVFMGTRVTLTKNLVKHCSFLNGMGAIVTTISDTGLKLKTDDGNTRWSHLYTDEDIQIDNELRQAVYFPLRLGYSTTVMKVKGTTLEHMTFCNLLASVSQIMCARSHISMLIFFNPDSQQPLDLLGVCWRRYTTFNLTSGEKFVLTTQPPKPIIPAQE